MVAPSMSQSLPVAPGAALSNPSHDVPLLGAVQRESPPGPAPPLGPAPPALPPPGLLPPVELLEPPIGPPADASAPPPAGAPPKEGAPPFEVPALVPPGLPAPAS